MKRKENDDTLLDLDFMFDPSVTQRILAAIDRSDDPHLHIDIIRRAVFQLAGKLSQMGNAIKVLQDAERERITDTGVWKIVKGKLDAEKVDWVKWAIRAGLAGLGTAFLSLMAVVLRLAWKGLHA